MMRYEKRLAERAGARPYSKHVSLIRSCVVLCLALVCTFLWPLTAAAQGVPAFSASVTEPFELVEAVGTTRRITRADIDARNARTLDEALRLIPGFYVRTGGDGTPRVDIRGFRSRHVLLLINGVQVNSTADGQFDPARISTAAIREIKVSYSSSSLLYGDNALAAVIEITTMDNQADSRFDVSVGTPDQRGASGRIARTIGPWSLMAAGAGHATGAFRLPGSFQATSAENGGRRDNSDRDRGEFRGGLGYRFSPVVSLSTEWSAGAGTYGVPSSVINAPADLFAQAVRYERVEDYRSASGQVSVVVTPEQRFNLRGWVYRNAQREDRARYDDATYSSMDDPLVQGTFESRERTTVTGSTALARVDLDRAGWLRVAVNQRREAFDSNGVIRDTSVAGRGGGGGGRGGGSAPATFGVRSFALDRRVDVWSAGAEWQARPSGRVGTVLGAALNGQRRDGQDADLEPTWIAGLSYDATADLRFHASATRKVRVPSIDQLYSAAAGNPALRSERTYGLDVGADRQLGPKSAVAVSGFVTQARDFIERRSGLPFANQGTYRFAGVELSASTTAIDRLNLRSSYTFLDANDATDGAINRRLQTRPRHRASVEWIWTVARATFIRGAAQYVGPQLFDSRGSTPVQLEVDPYGLVDLGVTQGVGHRFEITFDVTNLFDQLYEQSYGLPREGRTALLALRAGFR
jgi:vitamin B12 transporter